MPIYPIPQNILLRSASNRAPRLLGELGQVAFEAGHVFWDAKEAIPYAVFPLRGTISLRLSPGDGKDIEVAIVGREGFAGVCLSLGAEKAEVAAVAQTGGVALLMPREIFRRVRLASVEFNAAVQSYVRFFLVLVTRSAICTRAHLIEQQYIGRLLLIHDRIEESSFAMTQDHFSRLLGVRRASLSRIGAALQARGLIRFERGKITILDREHLETLACSCYREVKREFGRYTRSQGGF